MSRLLYRFAKVCHTVCPNYILLNLLSFLQHIPVLRKAVVFFDPNAIRKHVPFELPERLIFLRDKNYNFLVNSREHIGFRSYLRNEPFEMSLFKLAPKISSPGKYIIIDIGAHNGAASVPVCAKYGYELLAIEASKSNLPLLARNVLNNGLKARILPYALIDEEMDDYMKMFTNDGNTGTNSLDERWSPSVTKNKARRVEYVPTKTFDQLIKEEKIDVGSVLMTKIDVEGMEESVLKGAIEFLSVNDAPIILEYLPHKVQRLLGKDVRGILEIFERHDYSIHALTNEGSMIHFNPSCSYENIIAIKRGYEHNSLA